MAHSMKKHQTRHSSHSVSPVIQADEERRQHGGVTLEEATRTRAYQLWERAGRPEGNGVSFWLEAQAELLADN